MPINPERDYIRRGSCFKCKRNNVSVVIHHPRGRRSYAICSFCSKETWLAVGESNKENYLKYGEVTKPRPRTDRDRKKNPRVKFKDNKKR